MKDELLFLWTKIENWFWAQQEYYVELYSRTFASKFKVFSSLVPKVNENPIPSPKTKKVFKNNMYF